MAYLANRTFVSVGHEIDSHSSIPIPSECTEFSKKKKLTIIHYFSFNRKKSITCEKAKNFPKLITIRTVEFFEGSLVPL